MEVPAPQHSLVAAVAGLGSAIRYVAVHDGTGVHMWERSGNQDGSSAVSDRYEELFVNPTLLALLEARGAEGCGGLDYVVIRYGNFYQIVQRTEPGSHLSVAVSSDADPLEVRSAIGQILQRGS